ncbi:MAG: tRNA (adenosine(37)-N6)-threonylcarbamoyltransferase complex ATPase subunit type 1 TsaE [Clostridia bacterium]|nr:tRNA (adenosine(37)-N6)-threonylcarbamoyltransferase complex ATPase subunit type 1 TsaE [Clostridia bacterium]
MEVYLTKSAEDTFRLGKALAKKLESSDVVLLGGELGAGKTVFTKGIAEGLGVCDLITSPTFALHNSYSGNLILNHFDFYRITDESELYAVGLEEYFFGGSVCVVEWWENVKGLFKGKRCTLVQIEKTSDRERLITIDKDFVL